MIHGLQTIYKEARMPSIEVAIQPMVQNVPLNDPSSNAHDDDGDGGTDTRDFGGSSEWTPSAWHHSDHLRGAPQRSTSMAYCPSRRNILLCCFRHHKRNLHKQIPW
jgi:hypothetical protein